MNVYSLGRLRLSPEGKWLYVRVLSEECEMQDKSSSKYIVDLQL